jgi:quercetin dioxygenase-like cupin family protein
LTVPSGAVGGDCGVKWTLAGFGRRQGIEKANIMRPIDHFLGLAGSAVSNAATGDALSAGSRVKALLAEAPTPAKTLPPQRLEVCRYLAAACTEMRPDLAAAFTALEPALAWRTRTMPNASSEFAEGHASARLLDHTGLEQRGGLVSGFSLVAPGITYPEHNHPPEEIYLVLSAGEWWQAGRGWHAYGPGGIVHNPPNIRHAMRGTAVPLLAIWFLLPS